MDETIQQKDNFLMEYLVPDFVKQKVERSVIMYFFSGIVSTATDLGVYWFVSVFLGYHYIWGATAAFFVASGVNFSCNKFLTFRNGSKRIANQLARHLSVGASSLVISYFVLFVLIDLVGFSRMVGKIICSALLAVYGYFMHKHFTFKHQS